MTLKISKIEIACLTLIILVAAFCRLYRISDYMTFLGDEGRDALAVRNIVLGRHFPLIGPGTSVGNMYLGPLYYYLIAPSLLLANFSPVGMAVEVALIGLLTIALLWWMGREWFGPAAALGISFLYAISPSVIIYSRSSWNPNIMPFFALLAVFGTWNIWQKSNWRWLPVVALSLAFVLNSHYLGLLLFPTVGLFLLLSLKNLTSKPILIVSILLFLFLVSPLVLFDMRHGWANFNAMKTFFTDRGTTVNLKAYKALPFILPIWNDTVTSLLASGNTALGLLLSALLGIFTVVKLLTRKISPQFIFLLVWLIVGLTGLGLYRQHIYVHYFGFIFPVPFLLLGFFFASLNKKILMTGASVVIFVILTFADINGNPFHDSANFQLMRTETVSAFIDAQSGKQPFNLALLSKTNYDAGYRYFLELQNSPYRTIHDQLTDQLFVICENPDCKPIGNPLWEIASFGWAKIDKKWDFPWSVTVYRLIHNPTGT
jgi:4-amino-4-deoxy-L-arabinose transferase-like glycosyltransferase